MVWCVCYAVVLCPHGLAFTRRGCFLTKLAHSFLSHLCLSFCLPESFTCTSFHPKNIYPAAEIHRSGDEDTEVLGIKLILEGNPLSIYNLYSPPPKALRLHAIQPEEERWIIMGDFNSHSPSWGYPDLDAKGDEVEDWIITNQLY